MGVFQLQIFIVITDHGCFILLTLITTVDKYILFVIPLILLANNLNNNYLIIVYTLN